MAQLTPSAGSGGAPAQASGGSSGSSAGGTPTGVNTGGTSSEGNNVGGPLDTAGSAGEPGNAGRGSSSDAGETPVAAGPCPAGPFADSPLPAGPVPVPQQVCTGMTFTEGAVWFRERNTLFFSDFQIGNAGSNFTGRILSHTPGGGCEEFIAGAGTNGLAIAPDGNLLSCRHLDRTLTIFDLTTRQPTVFLADNAGEPFNTTNDVAIRSDGNLYFTDPDYLAGNRMTDLPVRAYRRDPNGVLSVIDEGGNTNGITLSPDETRLYLSHLGGGPANILVFDVDAAGAVSNPRPFVSNVGSDGMAIDCAGNLYITQNGVRIYDPEGELIGTLAAPGAANVAFGGPDRRTLFITATVSLLSVELEIPGLPY